MPDEVSRVLGLAGLRVTIAEPCPHCGDEDLVIKERPIVGVRDLALVGRVARTLGRKRRFRCRGCGRTHTEQHPDLPGRQRVSARFRARLAMRAASGGGHAEIAREEATSRYQVARALVSVGLPEPAPVRRLSLDEAHHRRGRELATVISDLDRGKVIEVLDGRSQRAVAAYLHGLPAEHRSAIEVVSIDPYEGYRRAIRAELPGVRIVADRFHLLRGANTALDSVRRERQRQIAQRRPKGARRSGHTSRWAPELFRVRRLLAKGRERLRERERRRLCELFSVDPVIGEAWTLKEAFRAIYRTHDRAEAEVRLDHFLKAVERAVLPAFSSFGAHAAGLQP